MSEEEQVDVKNKMKNIRTFFMRLADDDRLKEDDGGGGKEESMVTHRMCGVR